MKVYLNGKYSEQASANLMYAQSKEGMKKLGIALTNMAGEMAGMYSLYRLFTGTDPVTGSKVSRLEAGLWVALLLLPQAKMVEAVKTLRAGDRALAGAALTEADLMILSKAGYFDDVAKINKIEKASGAKSSGEDIFNYTNKVNEHMANPDRAVPAQTLKEAIKGGTPMPDPRGSSATMYYSEIYINGKKYNFEVLYDKATNTIYHFKYDRRPLGPLPAVPKQ